MRAINDVRPLSDAEDGLAVAQLDGVYGFVLADALAGVDDFRTHGTVVVGVEHPRKFRIELHVDEGRITMILLFVTRAEARYLSSVEDVPRDVVGCARYSRGMNRLVGIPTSRIRSWVPGSATCGRMSFR